MRSSRVLALVLALAAAAMLLPAPPAQAQAPPPPLRHSFVTVSAGVFVPEGADLDDHDADEGFAGFLNLGVMLNPFVGVQTDLGFFETDGDSRLHVTAVPLAASLRFAVPIAFVEPYVLAGGGVYFTQTELGNSDETSTELAWHAAAGVNFSLGRFILGAESRYVWLDATNPLGSSDLDIDGLMIMGKFGVRF